MQNTFSAFERYLGEWLLHSGEDCCSRCADCPPKEAERPCENASSREGLDDAVCLRGLLKQFEEENHEI